MSDDEPCMSSDKQQPKPVLSEQALKNKMAFLKSLMLVQQQDIVAKPTSGSKVGSEDYKKS